MDNKAISRKDFILLTFTLIGTTAVVGTGGCDDDDDTTGAGGAGGRGGTTGQAGTTGNAGRGGSGQGGTGGSTVSSCSGAQQPDSLGHVHTLAVPASALSSTTNQTFDTGLADGHVHPVILTPAQLSTLAGGGSVTVMSEIADGHLHTYAITCQ